MGTSPPTATAAGTVVVPTAVVVKNIPFSVKREQLLQFMATLGLPAPYAFNYHFDNGVFHGLAFANFHTAEETAAVIEHLNGREIAGRKLRVEYKKVSPGQGGLPRAPSSAPELKPRDSARPDPRRPGAAAIETTWQLSPHLGSPLPANLNFNEPQVLDLFTKLLAFKGHAAAVPGTEPEFLISGNPQRYQLEILSTLCKYLGLTELRTQEGVKVVPHHSKDAQHAPNTSPNSGVFANQYSSYTDIPLIAAYTDKNNYTYTSSPIGRESRNINNAPRFNYNEEAQNSQQFNRSALSSAFYDSVNSFGNDRASLLNSSNIHMSLSTKDLLGVHNNHRRASHPWQGGPLNLDENLVSRIGGLEIGAHKNMWS